MNLIIFNPFVPNALFLYPLKTSENLTGVAIMNFIPDLQFDKTKVTIQNSGVKCYHRFHVRSHKD